MKTTFWKKNQNRLGLILCAMVVLTGVAYDLMIHLSFIPNGEDLHLFWCYKMMDVSGRYFRTGNILWDFITSLIYKMVGMRYLAVRLEFTAFYGIVLFLTMMLSIVCNQKKKPFEMLPVFVMFMVLLPPVREGSAFGILWQETDMIYMYPYDYHAMSQIFCLLCLFFLRILEETPKVNPKRISFAMFAVVLLYGLGHTDLIFLVVFVVPFFLVCVLHLLRKERYHKICAFAGIGMMLCLFLTKFLPGSFFDRIWSMSNSGVYGEVYGATNLIHMNELGSNFTTYLDVIVQIFHIDLQGNAVLSAWLIVDFFKFLFLITGFAIIFSIVVKSVLGKAKESGYSMTDEIIAWGFVILSLVFMMTEIGRYSSNMRYVTILVALITILLCRHFGRMAKKIIQVFSIRLKNKKCYFVAFTCALVLCLVEPVWNYQASDSFWDDCNRIISYVEETGYGYAIAPHWLFARLTAMTKGNLIFYQSEEQLRERQGEDAEFAYLITTTNYDTIPNMFNNVADVASYEQLCEKYGTPSEVVPLQYVTIYAFQKELK